MQLLYKLPEAVALQWPPNLKTRAGAFQPPKNKPTHILSTLPLFGMFLITLKQRFPCLAQAVVHDRPNNEPNCQTLSRARKTTQILHWGSLSLCISFSTSRHLEPHFSKTDSPSSALIIRIYNKKTLELVLSLPVACFSLFGGHMGLFLVMLPQKACP